MSQGVYLSMYFTPLSYVGGDMTKILLPPWNIWHTLAAKNLLYYTYVVDENHINLMLNISYPYVVGNLILIRNLIKTNYHTVGHSMCQIIRTIACVCPRDGSIGALII